MLRPGGLSAANATSVAEVSGAAGGVIEGGKQRDTARVTRPTLPVNVTPHTLRHTKAMHLLQAGNPAIVIRDILGHADIQSTEIYAKADLEMKRQALEKTSAAPLPAGRWSCRRQLDLLRWLQSL